MLQFEELKRELEEQEAALQDLGQALGLEKLREEVEMLEHKSAEPGFWDNMEPVSYTHLLGNHVGRNRRRRNALADECNKWPRNLWYNSHVFRALSL